MKIMVKTEKRKYLHIKGNNRSSLVLKRIKPKKPFFLVVFQCDLLDMPAVGQLEKDAKYALVYQLLKIFLTQRLDAYLDFHAANSTLLKSYGNCFLILQHLKPCSGR